MFGESLVANAVHGASTVEGAQEAIQNFIGEVPDEDEEGESAENGEENGDADGEEGRDGKTEEAGMLMRE